MRLALGRKRNACLLRTYQVSRVYVCLGRAFQVHASRVVLFQNREYTRWAVGSSRVLCWILSPEGTIDPSRGCEPKQPKEQEQSRHVWIRPPQACSFPPDKHIFSVPSNPSVVKVPHRTNKYCEKKMSISSRTLHYPSAKCSHASMGRSQTRCVKNLCPPEQRISVSEIPDERVENFAIYIQLTCCYNPPFDKHFRSSSRAQAGHPSTRTEKSRQLRLTPLVAFVRR